MRPPSAPWASSFGLVMSSAHAMISPEKGPTARNIIHVSTVQTSYFRACQGRCQPPGQGPRHHQGDEDSRNNTARNSLGYRREIHLKKGERQYAPSERSAHYESDYLEQPVFRRVLTEEAASKRDEDR